MYLLNKFKTISLRDQFCLARRMDFLIRTALQRNGLSQQRIELSLPGNTQEEAICHVNSITEGGGGLKKHDL